MADNALTTKTDELLSQYATCRSELINNITSLDKMKDELEGKMTQSLNDYRNRFQLEERLKLVTGFYGTLLTYRQELLRSIQTEIEIRRKIEKGDDGAGEIDIAAVARKVEKAIKTNASASELAKQNQS